MTGRQLTELRLEAGHSIKSLAKEADVHEHSIRRLEDGKGVHPQTAKKIVDFYRDRGIEMSVIDLLPLDEAA